MYKNIYGGLFMDYLTSAEFAEKWNISRRRVTKLCTEERIKGAILKGNTWLIPADAEKPEDPRRVHKTRQEPPMLLE